MTPILYSFRRCPYAMRARLALAKSGVTVDLREVKLRDKPEPFLETSCSGTVPCLEASDGVIDESLDIMLWALRQNDPDGWLDVPDEGFGWIARCDGPFKAALDRTKYASRYPDCEPEEQRMLAAAFLSDLDLAIGEWIFDRATVVDYAILPFVRQFAFIDKDWFDAQPWPCLQHWLARYLESEIFTKIMLKYVQWQPGDPPIKFPECSE